MRIALGIEYDGSDFCGWQVQTTGPSIQAAVDGALSRVADEAIVSHCAGRTDAGVHACEQVVHFDTAARRDRRAWTLGANSYLPPTVAVRWAREVPEEFHARFSAVGRTYAFVISNRATRPGLWQRRVCWQYRPLDVVRMRQGAALLIGEHDFSAFRAAGCQAKHPIRRLDRLDIRRCGEWVVLYVAANAFLQHMVRNLAGVLMEIGSGARSPDWAREVLEGRDRRRAGVTAAAAGLYFVRAEYPPHFDLPAEPAPLPLPVG